MIRCHSVRSAGQYGVTGGEQKLPAPSDTITLDETGRHRRRLVLSSDHGIEFLLDLPEAALLRSGDHLLLEDGRLIEVRAAPEPLYEIRAQSVQHLLRLTWHLGNRHLASEIHSDHVRIRADAVIGRMIEQLGGTIRLLDAAFDPEAGAYGQPGGHSSDHSHGRTDAD